MITTDVILQSVATAALFVVIWNTVKIATYPIQRWIDRRKIGIREDAEKIKKDKSRNLGYLLEIIFGMVIADISIQLLNPGLDVIFLINIIFTVPVIILFIFGDKVIGRRK